MQLYAAINPEESSSNPRDDLWKHLTTYIQTIQTTHHIILAMDANSDTNLPTSQISKLITSTNLVDTFANPANSPPTRGTFKRGQKRIDVILVSLPIARRITQCINISTNLLSTADHDGLIIDIDSRDLLKCNDTFQPRVPRTLHLKQTKSVQKYIANMEKEMKQHTILPQLQMWEHHMKYNSITPTHIERYQRIQNQLARSMRASEKHCIHQHGKYPWSPALRTAGKKLSLLTTILRLHKHRPTIAMKFQNELRQHSISPEDLRTTPRILQHRKQAAIELKDIQLQAENLRTIHLQERANFYSKHKQANPHQVLQQIIHTELVQQLYKKLKYVKEKDNSHGVSSIIVPGSNGSLQHIQRINTTLRAVWGKHIPRTCMHLPQMLYHHTGHHTTKYAKPIAPNNQHNVSLYISRRTNRFTP